MMVALQGVKLLRHDLFTNDVLYLELALDLRPLPPKLLPLLPLFCRCAAQSYVAVPLTQLSGHVLLSNERVMLPTWHCCKQRLTISNIHAGR